MTFDVKAWNDANREKIKLYSVRYRMKKKGLDPIESTEQLAAERAAKKVASKERERERKKAWAQANKARKNRLYRERYHSDPEFRRREIDKRMKAFGDRLTEEQKLAKRTAKKLLTQQNREERLRQKREEAAKLKRAQNAKRHAADLLHATKITSSKPQPQLQRRTTTQSNHRKPGRLTAMAGWLGW